MKKIALKGSLFIFSGFGLSVYGQYNGRVGINTIEPQATLDISKVALANLPKGRAQGVMLPNIKTSERNIFTGVKAGTMIYNTTKNCIDWYNGTQWSCLDGSQADIPPVVSSAFKSGDKQTNSVYDAKQ